MDTTHLLSSGVGYYVSSYGYVAVALIIGLESMGLPLPGETALVAAAVLAGTSHTLDIWYVIFAGAAGAIIGDNIGFAIGRSFGVWLLTRYGPLVGIDEPRVALGQYLFYRYGGGVVFFGRFIALLRALAAFLAGANRMPWTRFLVYNAAGGLAWTSLYGGAAYVFGEQIRHLTAPLALGLGAFAFAMVIAAVIFLRRHEAELLRQARLHMAVDNGRRPHG